MAAGKTAGSRRTGSRNNMAYYQTYVDGNTVRKIEAVPADHGRRKEHREQVSSQTRKTREKALQINIGYALFLTAIMGLLLFGCVGYLQIQARVTATMKSINAKESELSDLRAENDAEYNRVVASVDLESVRQIAMEELGMVYASEDQVVLYDSKDTDYVRQYQDVPTDSEGNSIQSKAAAIFGR